MTFDVISCDIMWYFDLRFHAFIDIATGDLSHLNIPRNFFSAVALIAAHYDLDPIEPLVTRQMDPVRLWGFTDSQDSLILSRFFKEDLKVIWEKQNW